MRHIGLTLLGTLACLVCSMASLSTVAQSGSNVLVMGEDADPVSVPRRNRVFGRVLDAISNELHTEGFDVFDETTVTAPPFEGRIRRNDRKTIEVARSVVQPPIDVVVIFSIFASPEHFSQITRISIRVKGRLLNVRSGQRLGNFEVVSPKSWSAPIDCPRNCILEIIGKYSQVLGRDVAAVLAEKLDDMTQGSPTKNTPYDSEILGNSLSFI